MTDTARKLYSHIDDGDDMIHEAVGLMKAVRCLTTCILESEVEVRRKGPGSTYPHHATVDNTGLWHAVDVLAAKLDGLQSWHTQLHELAVVRAGEKADA